MKLLLDTHAFIWWDSDPGQLSPAALTAIGDPANEVWLSIASVWEMIIKAQLGNLSLRLPLAEIIAQQQQNGILILSAHLDHVLAVEKLPAAHKDPFDRIMVAQAKCEDLTIITDDEWIPKYAVKTP